MKRYNYEQTMRLLKESIRILGEMRDQFDKLDQIDKMPQGSNDSGSVPTLKAKTKKKITKAVNSPSKFSSISFLKNIISNNGLTDRLNGKNNEYSIEEAKELLWEKEMEHYEKRAQAYEQNFAH